VRSDKRRSAGAEGDVGGIAEASLMDCSLLDSRGKYEYYLATRYNRGKFNGF
jgi:hypothetical protein